jgi:hypothetical protein
MASISSAIVSNSGRVKSRSRLQLDSNFGADRGRAEVSKLEQPLVSRSNHAPFTGIVRWLLGTCTFFLLGLPMACTSLFLSPIFDSELKLSSHALNKKRSRRAASLEPTSAPWHRLGTLFQEQTRSLSRQTGTRTDAMSLWCSSGRAGFRVIDRGVSELLPKHGFLRAWLCTMLPRSPLAVRSPRTGAGAPRHDQGCWVARINNSDRDMRIRSISATARVLRHRFSLVCSTVVPPPFRCILNVHATSCNP